MRKLILLSMVALTSSTYIKLPKQDLIEVPSKEVTLEIETPKPELNLVTIKRDLTPLVNALMWVESRCDTSAYCKREDAVGVLQIRPIMVKEVNRVLGLQGSSHIYTLEDRWSEDKSIEMFNVIANYYHETSSYEKIARCWNGGPKGLQKKQTQKYWRKVQKRLKYNENSTDRESEV
jgi:hypothetical protein